MEVFWIAVAVAFAVLEMATVQLVSIWFTGGAIAALISAICGADVYVQITVFALVALVLLIATRPFVKKLQRNKAEQTNADSLPGRTVVITEEVDNLHSTGAVRISGVTWSVRSENDEKISEGETATIVKIDGVKLIVKKNQK